MDKGRRRDLASRSAAWGDGDDRAVRPRGRGRATRWSRTDRTGRRTSPRWSSTPAVTAGWSCSKSVDGGRTFAEPVVAHRSASCDVSDDKNWLVVDTSPDSPHRGRLYQFWTPFLTDMFGNADGSPQALVWSDDGGATWSDPVNVSAPHANTQNSQPMLRPRRDDRRRLPRLRPRRVRRGPEAAAARAGSQPGRSAAAESAPGRREHRIPRPDHGNVSPTAAPPGPTAARSPETSGDGPPGIPLLPSVGDRRSRHRAPCMPRGTRRPAPE